MRNTLALSLLALVACFDAESPDGASCVPGQATMCWCDGLTPGVQSCGPDNTYAPCVCGDTDGPMSTADGSTGMVGETSGSGPVADSTGAPGSSSDSTTGSPVADSSTGEPLPTECTDMDFAFWQACRSLASFENPSPCMPCFGANACENAQCSLDCAALGNPGLDAAYAACDQAYPLCPDAWPGPSPYNECLSACYEPYNTCLVAALPLCESDALLACLTMLSECQTACQRA